jgi:CHAT domain-containing protein
VMAVLCVICHHCGIGGNQLHSALGAGRRLRVRHFRMRLVVASACLSAVIEGYTVADEALGLATAFIGAGAAGVVATLWSVDDYATALLMSKFYENLTGEGLPEPTEPAAALRQAQLWLRQLTREQERNYLRSHPMLRIHRDSKLARTGRSAGEKSSETHRPFSAASFWAPFVLHGA